MLSILIPVYEYDVSSLVVELDNQASKLNIEFEIICLNDASSFVNPCPNLESLNWIKNETNLGRARSRNKLVSLATHKNVLFLDADMEISNSNFIKNYLSKLELASVICGGIEYQKSAPADSYKLRWNYGKKYEARTAQDRSEEPYGSFMTGNFMAKKEVFEKHPFDESLTLYGHEDTLLGKELLEDVIEIVHIDNPAIHAGLESNEVFIQKTKEGLESLLLLYNQNKITRHYSGVIRVFEKLKSSKTLFLMMPLIALLENVFHKSLVSKGKHLWLFQLLKLKWFVELLKKS